MKNKLNKIKLADNVYCSDLKKSGVVIFESNQTVYVDVKFVSGDTKVIHKNNLQIIANN